MRIQALWTLNGLQVLSAEPLLMALNEPGEMVREQAARLSAGFVRRYGTLFGPMADVLLRLVYSSSPRVRYQVAFTLGEWNDPRAAKALVQLAGDEDENIRNAALSSAPMHAKAMLPLVEKLPTNERARAVLADAAKTGGESARARETGFHH